MNVPQYLLVEGFKRIFLIYSCNLHVAAPRKLQPRMFWKKKGSHLNKLGGFLAQGTNATTHIADKITGAYPMATRLSLERTEAESK